MLTDQARGSCTLISNVGYISDIESIADVFFHSSFGPWLNHRKIVKNRIYVKNILLFDNQVPYGARASAHKTI